MKIMNILFLLTIFNPLNSMQKKSRVTPEKIIQINHSNPGLILRTFKKSQIENLLDFRYGANNNVLHCTVETLIQQKKSIKNFPKLLDNYKPLFTWLVDIGVDINHVNDDYNSPYDLIVNADDDNEELNLLEDFFIDELGVKYTHVPLAADWKLLKKYIRKIITCDWLENKQS